MSTKEQILPGRYYHLYNHSNGYLNLFRTEDNYHYFLEKYKKYVHPYADTFAYCLMPNHFHFLVRIKEEFDDNIKVSSRSFNLMSSDLFKRSELIEPFSPIQVTNAIKNWLISYTQAYHKIYKTRGNLFYQKIRRKVITDENYLLTLVAYIHLNPIIHGFAHKLEEWPYSSFPHYMYNSPSILNTHVILDLFDDRQNFLDYHNQKLAADILKIIDLDFQIMNPAKQTICLGNVF